MGPLSVGSTAAAAEVVEEKYDSGQVRVRYEQTDGKKSGDYEEFFENGQPKVVAKYRNDQLDGEFVRYHESGKVNVRANYRRGKLHGAYLEKDAEGEPKFNLTYTAGKPRGRHFVHRAGQRRWEFVWKAGEISTLDDRKTLVHTRKELERGLAKIYRGRIRTKGVSDEQIAALRRLNAYRFLCGLPADVVFDEKQNAHCQAGAELLAKIQRLEHTPAKPEGMDEARYQSGYLGTSNGNIAATATLPSSVDLYMHDSDAMNIAHVGHRRWCMNPAMRTTGFGRDGNFCVMWSMDERRKPAPAYEMVAFPPPGYLPVDYFSTQHAWSVALNRRVIKSSESSEAKIYPLDENLVPGPPLAIVHKSYVGTADPGVFIGPENVLIFKPTGLDLTAGRRYVVEIRGITDKNNEEMELRYVVQFIEPVGAAGDDK